MKTSPALCRFFHASVLLAATQTLHAQSDFFWDSNGEAEGTGGAGVWDAASSLWRSDSDAGSLVPWPNADPAEEYAQFAGTAGSVTLNSDSTDLIVNRIVFSTTGYEIAGPSSGTAAVILSGTNPQVNTGTSVDAVISAMISGTSNLTKTGAGTLTLSGTNSYSGNTIVGGGTLNISGDYSNANGGWTVNNNGVVNFQAGSNIEVGTGNKISFANGGTSARSMNVFGTVTTSDTSSLSVRGRSTLNLESGSDWTQNGPLTIQPLNTTYSSTVNVKSGARLTYAGPTDIIVSKAATGNNGNGTLAINGGTFTTARGMMNSNGGSGNGFANLNFSNGGTLVLSADIPSLIIEGSTPFRVTANSGGGIIDTAGFDTSIGVEVRGVGGLTKVGLGTLTLSGTNSYAGETSVTEGTLNVTGALSNSAVMVGVSGAIASNGGNGILGNGLTIEEGGQLDLTGAIMSLNSTGILGLTGGSLVVENLSFEDLVGWDWMSAALGTYKLIDGEFTIDFGDTAYLSRETAYDFNNGRKGYFTDGSLNVVVIPEPSTTILGGLGLLALLRRRRSNRFSRRPEIWLLYCQTGR